MNLRKIDGFSPTAYKTYKEDKPTYVKKYLLGGHSPDPQTTPMMFGSAFDAYVKNALAARFGKLTPDMELDVLLATQCEPQFFPTFQEQHVLTPNLHKHARSRFPGAQVGDPVPGYLPTADARLMGAKLFEAYKKSGAYRDLVDEIVVNSDSLQMEFDVNFSIAQTHLGPVHIKGKPDIKFTNAEGARVVYDWKCNSIRSNSASPAKGYVLSRDASPLFQTKSHLKAHPACSPTRHKGMLVNGSKTFHTDSPEWALQLCMYSWCMGEPVGGDFIVGIDQIIGPEARIRVSSFRTLVCPDYQRKLADDLTQAFININSGLIWPELSLDENMANIVRIAQSSEPVDTSRD